MLRNSVSLPAECTSSCEFSKRVYKNESIYIIPPNKAFNTLKPYTIGSNRTVENKIIHQKQGPKATTATNAFTLIHWPHSYTSI